MSRFLRLCPTRLPVRRFRHPLTYPQLGHAVIPPPGDPAYNQDCPSGSPCVRPPQRLAAYSFVVSLTEGNIAEEYSVARVRSAFGSTLDFSLTYNSYTTDGSPQCLWGLAPRLTLGWGMAGPTCITTCSSPGRATCFAWALMAALPTSPAI